MQDRRLFEGSPFALTATAKTGACWAGRPDVLKNIARVLRSLSNRPDSTLDLIWANFGAGKSHALYHIAHLLGERHKQFVPVFVEVPEPVRRFTDLYARIISASPCERFAQSVMASPSGAIVTDLKRAAHVILNGNSSERSLAIEWLGCGHPHLHQLKKYTGISARIETDIQAVDVLSEIIQALARDQVRLVILLDEFQRLGVLSDKVRSTILSSLRSLFNRNPSHLSVVAAATTKIQKTALDLLPQELRTLLGMRPAVSLPEMTEDEAYEFVLQRFKCFRPVGYDGGVADPVGEEAVRKTIGFIHGETSARLIPRTLLQALSWIFDDSEGREVSGDRVRDLLTQLSWDSAGENS